MILCILYDTLSLSLSISWIESTKPDQSGRKVARSGTWVTGQCRYMYIPNVVHFVRLAGSK